MIKDIRFFKQDNKWYADVPNHSLEDNEMVLGADSILELISEGKPELTITLADTKPENYYLHFAIDEHDDEGAWYAFDGPWYTSAMNALIDALGLVESKIWVCNVTHDVFGEHPEEMWLIKIS